MSGGVSGCLGLGVAGAVRDVSVAVCVAPQTHLKRTSNACQTHFKRISHAFQTHFKRTSNAGLQTHFKRASNALQTRIKCISNARQTHLKRNSNASQTHLKRTSKIIENQQIHKKRPSSRGVIPIVGFLVTTSVIKNQK